METFVVENEILLLEPVSFTLLIKRNLSTAWFTSIPDIDMSGRLNKINVLISKEDYVTALKVLEENLGEIVEDTKSVQNIGQTEKKLEVEVLQHHETGKFKLKLFVLFTMKQTNYIFILIDKFGGTAIINSEDTDFQEQVHIHTSIKFEFVMDSLVISLFTGGSKMVLTYSLQSSCHLYLTTVYIYKYKN